MNRPSRISDGANARAVYNYIGPARLKQKTLLNGASTVSTYKLLYNGVAQITSALYRNSGDTATIIGYEHGYDKMGNPQYEIRTHQSSEGDAYMYDSLYRVTRTIYDDSDPTSPTYASARTDDWLMDDIGNRTKIYAKSATPTEYEHNAVNEYTSVGGTDYEYDAAGNLTKDDTHYYYWDYENRLTKVELVDGGADVAAYTYDANNRRVEKLDYTADPDETMQYFYNAWSCIEEREDDGTLLATYINGPTIDNYVAMERDGSTYWYMQSPIVSNVAALVDSNGAIQEGYKYRAYGEATVLTGSGNDTTWFTSDDDTATTSAIGNPYTFTGRRLDAETMLMHFRMRMYEPETGLFICRDPSGYTDGMSLYIAYFVPSGVDPEGLAWVKKTGNVYAATQDKDDLRDLAKEITGSQHDWTCIMPLGTICDWYRYDNSGAHALKGAMVDVSNLTAAGKSLFISVNDINTYRSAFWGSQVFNSDKHAASLVHGAAMGGKTPLKLLVVAGHGWSGQQSIGGHSQVTNAAAWFHADDLNKFYPRDITFDRAKHGNLPVRCWFTRTAKVFGAGCNTALASYGGGESYPNWGRSFAEEFARQNLRTTARAYGTMGSIKYFSPTILRFKEPQLTFTTSKEIAMMINVWKQYPGILP